MKYNIIHHLPHLLIIFIHCYSAGASSAGAVVSEPVAAEVFTALSGIKPCQYVQDRPGHDFRYSVDSNDTETAPSN